MYQSTTNCSRHTYLFYTLLIVLIVLISTRPIQVYYTEVQRTAVCQTYLAPDKHGPEHDLDSIKEVVSDDNSRCAT